MRLADVARELALENLTPELAGAGEHPVDGAHATDLLSDVLGHAPRGALLITIQVHMNVVAVAMHAELAGVIFAAGRRPDEPVRLKAVEESLPLYASTLTAFDIAGRLYACGLRGSHG